MPETILTRYLAKKICNGLLRGEDIFLVHKGAVVKTLKWKELELEPTLEHNPVSMMINVDRVCDCISDIDFVPEILGMPGLQLGYPSLYQQLFGNKKVEKINLERINAKRKQVAIEAAPEETFTTWVRDRTTTLRATNMWATTTTNTRGRR